MKSNDGEANPKVGPVRLREQLGHNCCPCCGRRLSGRSRRQQTTHLAGWKLDALEQLVADIDITEVSMLLGISRHEVKKLCQSLGVHAKGSEKEER